MTKIRLLLCSILLLAVQLAFADNDVFVYILLYGGQKGTVVYCGITNDPEARAKEHAIDRTMMYNTFDTMLVIAGPMSRSEALKLETKCIYTYDIPRLYQTYPNDPDRPSELDMEEREIAIWEYELLYDTSRLNQTLYPKVIYNQKVLDNIKSLTSKKIDNECIKCGKKVTDGVSEYSLDQFGQVFCRNCQSRYKGPICENCHTRVSEGVFKYSLENLGIVLCMGCQSKL